MTTEETSKQATRQELQCKLDELNLKNLQVQTSLSRLNAKVRSAGRNLPQDEYQAICRQQASCKMQILDIQRDAAPIRSALLSLADGDNPRLAVLRAQIAQLEKDYEGLHELAESVAEELQAKDARLKDAEAEIKALRARLGE